MTKKKFFWEFISREDIFLQTVMQQLYIHQRIICIPFCIYAVQIIIWSDSIQALSCHSKSRTLRLFQHFITLDIPTFHILSKFKSCENKISKDQENDETFRKQNNPYCAVERMNRLTIKILPCLFVHLSIVILVLYNCHSTPKKFAVWWLGCCYIVLGFWFVII